MKENKLADSCGLDTARKLAPKLVDNITTWMDDNQYNYHVPLDLAVDAAHELGGANKSNDYIVPRYYVELATEILDNKE